MKTWLAKYFLVSLISVQAELSDFYEDYDRNRAREGISSDTYLKYDRGCQGDLFQTPKYLAKLKCRYIHNNIDFLRIAPFKLEEAHKNPLMAIYHDVISDSEIKILQDYVEPLLTDSLVRNTQTGELFQSAHRVGKTSPHNDSAHILFKTLSRRVEDMTELSTESASTWNVNTYDVGGTFKPHHDYTINPDLFGGRGHRLASLLLYLNDVPAGGLTSFPILDVAFKPQKGSLLFWVNLLENGVPNVNTFHGGCPVKEGKKWLAVRFLHEKGQKHMCGLTVKQ